jgi:hypothetical protein
MKIIKLLLRRTLLHHSPEQGVFQLQEILFSQKLFLIFLFWIIIDSPMLVNKKQSALMPVLLLQHNSTVQECDATEV